MKRAVVFKGGAVLLSRVEVAEGGRERMKGLLGRKGLPEGHALYLAPCGSIHTFFMRFGLDLIFVDAEWRVCRVTRNVGPFRIAWGGRAARGVLEMSAGWLPQGAVSAGDRLVLEEVSSER